MDLKDEVEQFKRECKSIKYLRRKQKELEEEIQELDHALAGVKSPSLDTPPSTGYASNDYKLCIIEKQKELNRELSLILERIGNVYNTLEQIEDESEKALIIDLWVEKRDYRKVARKYGYEDKSVFKKAKMIVKRYLKVKSGH